MANSENPRVLVEETALLTATQRIGNQLKERIEQKGSHSYASNHEALGLITEEYYELLKAVRKNDNENVKEELVDIAVGCIFALASMIQKEPVS